MLPRFGPWSGTRAVRVLWFGVGRANPAGAEKAGGRWVRVSHGSPAAARLLAVGEGDHTSPHFRNLLGRCVSGVRRKGKSFGQGRKPFGLGNPRGGTWPEEVGRIWGGREKVGEMHPIFGGNHGGCHFRSVVRSHISCHLPLHPLRYSHGTYPSTSSSGASVFSPPRHPL